MSNGPIAGWLGEAARRRTRLPGSVSSQEARADNAWLAAGSCSVQQQALRDYNQAVRNWLTVTVHIASRRGVKQDAMLGSVSAM